MNLAKQGFIFSILIIFSAPAFAYIDPGSGSAIMSAIIGFAVAIGLAVKTYWYKIKSLFIKKANAPTKTLDTASENKQTDT